MLQSVPVTEVMLFQAYCLGIVNSLTQMIVCQGRIVYSLIDTILICFVDGMEAFREGRTAGD